MHLPKAMIKYWLDFTAWKRQNQPWFAQAKRQFIRDAHRNEGSAEGPGQGEATGSGALSGNTQGQFTEGKSVWSEAGQ